MPTADLGTFVLRRSEIPELAVESVRLSGHE